MSLFRCKSARAAAGAFVKRLYSSSASSASGVLGGSSGAGANHVRLPLQRRVDTCRVGGGISASLHGYDSATGVPSTSSGGRREITTSAIAERSSGNAPTTVKFTDLDLCEPSLRAIREIKGFEFATAVQDQTLTPILQGKDVLVRAKTGSGKTIGFLLPAIETLMRRDPAQGSITVLILSPTRELSVQIYDETLQLLTFNKKFGAQVVYGGRPFSGDLGRMRAGNCDILVATPGRIIQHLEEGDAGRRLRECQMLVLDEADRLLDMGFKPAIEKILRYVPPQRQTLLFSATVSNDIKKIASKSLRPGHVFVDCVGEDDANSATNPQVTQSAVIVPLRDHMAMLKQTIDEHCAKEPNHKIMCFFTTGRMTGLAAELFGKMRTDIVEIHSRLSQPARTKAADQFRAAKRAVMMSSDVTARGIDFPDVTLVIQIGVPSQREQYIHRLGRTARAGKSGEGIIILGPREDYFIRKEIGDLPVKTVNPAVNPAVAREVDAMMATVKLKSKVQTYQAWLGYHKPLSKKMNWTPEQLVAEANHYAVDVLGCPEVPPILRKTVGNMGLKGVAGLNIVSELPEYGSSYGSKIGRQRRQG